MLDELLLVCSRSHYKDPEYFEKNGRVYTRTGEFKREILHGDGIQTVQTTSTGIIWTSYFDEGVFGNYGWGKPVGSSGLVAWDTQGRKLYEFTPSEGLDSICDCYALNVETEEDVWCYYYTEFPLVRLRRRENLTFWKIPLAGSDAFAVAGEYALFRGGYKDHDIYQLFSIKSDGSAVLNAKIELRNQQNEMLVANWVVGRADTIYLANNGSVYCIDVWGALAE